MFILIFLYKIWQRNFFLQVFLVFIRTSFGIVATKRRNPRPDEIERIINETHSIMWNCKGTECHPGLGLNVHCGTSIPFSIKIKCDPCEEGVNFSETNDYSTCKRCMMCGKHEKKTGNCTLEEDTTVCLRVCHKGFYMDLISGECHPCSDCCGQNDKYHEKNCEDSGFPSSKQCREHNLNCPDKPSKSTAESKDHDKDQGGLEVSEIVGIVLGTIGFLAIVIVVILGQVCGWQLIRDTLTSWFCRCGRLGASLNGHGNIMYFDVAGGQTQRSEHDPELGAGKSEHNFSGEDWLIKIDLLCN